MTIEAKKLSIIEQVLAIEEEQVLDAILSELAQAKVTDNLEVLQEEEVSYQADQNGVEATEKEEVVEEKLDFRDAVVEWREVVPFEQLMKEQNYQPITYDRIREIADEMEWEHSLDELLEALD